MSSFKQEFGQEEKHPTKELYAICVIFFVLGVSFSTLAARMPAIRDSARLIPATLGYVLLIRGLGTVTVMPLVAVAIQKYSTRSVALASGLGIAFVLIPIAFAGHWMTLAVAMLLLGAAEGAYNVSINALASDIEVKSGKSKMSIIHAFFGIGNLAGALISTSVAGLGISIISHFIATAIVLVFILFLSFHYVPKPKRTKKARSIRLSFPKGSLIWVGAIGFMGAAVESSVNNWVALFFTDRLGMSEGSAPIGYVAYVGAMLLMRLVGDRLKMMIGARVLLIAGSVLGCSGIILALSTSSFVVATIGFFAAGAGVSLTFPMIFSAAGKEGPLALASIATMGYLGGMISQPLVGAAVSGFNLFGGFVLIAIMTGAIAFFAWKATLLNRQ
ncbi:MAG: MFS transporter [Balneolaceae bacterium]|nr:MFS transporter [Balneolaceae bacterium]